MKTIANWYDNLSVNTRYALDLLIVALAFVVTGVTIMGVTAALCVYIHPIAGLFGFLGMFGVIAHYCDN